MTTLSGKTVLVTGALGGIGEAMAHAFAHHGADLIVHDLPRYDKVLKEQAHELTQQYGIRTHLCCCDLSNQQDIENTITTLLSSTPIDIIINNAGIQHLSSVEHFPVEMWQKIIQINLSSVFHLSRLVLPSMKKRGFGRIINIASVHAMIASVNKAAYVAAKHGVLGLTRSIALENAQTPITANCICPGFVMTKLVAQQIEQLAKEKGLDYDTMKKRFIEDKHPSGQFIEAKDLGELAVFLAGPHAQEMRGSALVMDGGWSIQ